MAMINDPIPSGCLRVYIDLPVQAYDVMQIAADRHGMDVAQYLLSRALAAPITMTGDFVPAPRDQDPKP